ncbi:MAG: electron transfer flavoprotein subunit beta/FixA family protein [Firmicutes bacterium]|nr:electron transfer flavoprotein subunit beta/FixA family protein [Bacillota bacterium]
MRIAVCVKLLPDPASVELDYCSGRVDQKRLVYVTSPFDLRAVEEALLIRESVGGKITVFSVGPEGWEESLRECIGMGVDEVLRIWGDEWTEETPPPAVAFALAQQIKDGGYDLVLCGDPGSQLEAAKVPAWVAEYLGWPLLTAITRLEVILDRGVVLVHRKLEKGKRQELECSLPAVIAVDISLNEPRGCSLTSLVNALESEIDVFDLPLSSVMHMLPEDVMDIMIDGLMYESRHLRPEPRLIFAPEYSLPAYERISQLVSGGLGSKKGSTIKGSAEDAAGQIISFLINKGIID